MLIFRICAIALIVVIAAERPAAAQSFFEKLFGIGQQQAQTPAQLPPAMPSYRAPLRVPPPRVIENSDIESRTSRPRGKIRTMCVRLCDGYYFPLSNSTTARRLTAENARCKASCGGESRLFYSDASNEPDPAAMIDLTGRRYDALDVAFAYRKMLHPGCACRPPPWSAAEKVRHFKYALEAAQAEMEKVAATDLEPVAAGKKNGKPGQDKSVQHVASDDTGNSVPLPPTRQLQTTTRHETTADHSSTQRTPPRRQRKSIEQRSAEHRPPDQRKRYSNASNTGAGSGGGLFGFGGQKKFLWPGDAR